MNHYSQVANGDNNNQNIGGTSIAQGKGNRATHQMSAGEIRTLSGFWGFLGGVAASIVANLICNWFLD